VNRFDRVKLILDTAVGGPGAVIAAPHGTFWRSLNRAQFLAFTFAGVQLVMPGDGAGSGLVKALRGQFPFGKDIGVVGATFRRMPAGRDPVPDDQIAVISRWIDDGAHDTDEPVGALDVLLGGAASGQAFLVTADPGRPPIPGNLQLRTTDGSSGTVTISSPSATLQFDPATVAVSGSTTTVAVLATDPSTARNDLAIEVAQAGSVLTTFQLTAVAKPAVRFRGIFQCRLATDPDAYDDPWGHDSSFGMYAVQGPDPDHPDEPPLDRIVRFSGAVAPRPFCPAVGVRVSAIEAQVGGVPVTFDAGDPLIGRPVELGPECVLDGRNEAFAPNGFEPIANFRMNVADVFAGASAPALPRATPADPPPSTAPYANGIILLDADPAGGTPADFGLAPATWAENGWRTLAVKQARLSAQADGDDRANRIRDRRKREHTDTRPGHGLGAMFTPMVFMERYTGLIDEDLTFAAEPAGVLSYLAGLQAVRIIVDFLDFDTDCQTGRVTGTLDAPVAAAPDAVADAAPQLRRVPLDQQ
jgi:hypothetical protein